MSIPKLLAAGPVQLSLLVAAQLALLMLLAAAASADVQSNSVQDPVNRDLQRRFCDVSNPGGWGLYYCEHQNDPGSYVLDYPGGVAQENGPYVPKTAGVRWGFLCCPKGQRGTGKCGYGEQLCEAIPPPPTPTPTPAPVNKPQLDKAVLTFAESYVQINFGDCQTRAASIWSYFGSYCALLKLDGVIHQRGACLNHAHALCREDSEFIRAISEAFPCNLVPAIFDKTVLSRSCLIQANVGCSACDY